MSVSVRKAKIIPQLDIGKYQLATRRSPHEGQHGDPDIEKVVVVGTANM